MPPLLRQRLRISHHGIDSVIHETNLIMRPLLLRICFSCLPLRQAFHLLQAGNQNRIPHARNHKGTVSYPHGTFQLNLIDGRFSITASRHEHASILRSLKAAVLKIHDKPRPVEDIGMLFFVKGMSRH